jgi:hypothetical protein
VQLYRLLVRRTGHCRVVSVGSRWYTSFNNDRRRKIQDGFSHIFRCSKSYRPTHTDGIYASVSGGSSNSANGDSTSVSGGEFNDAFGQNASISGGQFNEAGSIYASVCGGGGNTAGGFEAVVIGGSNIIDTNSNSIAPGAPLNYP